MTASVSCEAVPILECLLALIARERLLIRMNPQVQSEGTFLIVLIVTVGARERFFACVDSIMNPQLARMKTVFAANITFRFCSHR